MEQWERELKLEQLKKALGVELHSDGSFEEIIKGNKHYFSSKERENLADKDQALPDGSFPIRNAQDLRDAIRSVGRAKDPERARRWIKRRAKELGLKKELPEHWKDGGEDKEDIISRAIETGLLGAEVFEKGKPAKIGEIRTWNGVKMRKVAPDKWEPVKESAEGQKKQEKTSSEGKKSGEEKEFEFQGKKVLAKKVVDEWHNLGGIVSDKNKPRIYWQAHFKEDWGDKTKKSPPTGIGHTPESAFKDLVSKTVSDVKWK